MHRPHKIIKNKITQNDIMDHRVSIDGASLYMSDNKTKSIGDSKAGHNAVLYFMCMVSHQ